MALEVSIDGQPPRTFENEEALVLGSDADCDIRVNGAGVETRHAILVRQGARWQIFDLKTRAGIEVNGRPVRRADLIGHDELRVGSCVVKLANGVAAAPANMFRGGSRSRSPAPAPTAEKSGSRPPVQVRNFVMAERIHRGSTGEFYKAYWKTKDNRPVVIKFISSQLCLDEQAMYRFCRGVTAAGEIRHPNIVRLYRAGKADNRWYLAMEWLAHGSLKDLMTRRAGEPLPASAARRMGIDICQALMVAADRGVIHRKVTPGSILFDENDTAKLGDFVLAREEEQQAMYQLTAQGQPLGELAYLAPEQAEGSTDLDRRVDTYGLAATLYEAVTGQPPCRGKDLVETLKFIRSTPPIPPRSVNPAIPHDLEDILLKGLAKRPVDRFQDASEFKTALESIGSG